MHLSKNMIAAAGEYLVCAELCRRNVLALVTPKNNPVFDVLASDPAGVRTATIQVKTMAETNKQGWKFGVDMEREIENEDMFVILVNLQSDGMADFYPYVRNELSRKIQQLYSRYLSKPKRDGTPRKPTAFRWFNHTDFDDDDRSRKNRWELLGFPMIDMVKAVGRNVSAK